VINLVLLISVYFVIFPAKLGKIVEYILSKKVV
jgi:hypothetical protein